MAQLNETSTQVDDWTYTKSDVISGAAAAQVRCKKLVHVSKEAVMADGGVY